MLGNLKKWLWRAVLGLLVLLLVVGVGRQVQKYIGGFYFGDRAVYLQQLGSDTVTLRWQTQRTEKGAVTVYPQADEAQAMTLEEPDAGRAHSVTLTGLQPDTLYSYRVGSGRQVLYAGKDYWFRTAPRRGAGVPVRLWVQGDPGYWHDGTRAVREAAIAWSEAHPRGDRPLFDLWLTTGDNAYRSGSNEQFQSELFEPYSKLLRNTPYIPAYGNHDDRRWAFYDNFTFPEQGELGGVPSGTEHYFSFDYGPLHVVFLDTETGDLDADGGMGAWLDADLKANRQPWTIAVFHHPPYSRGSHDSDKWLDSWGRMAATRENIVPILEQYDVDLVLSGHSHVYERSYPLACHYGSADTLQANMLLDRDNHFDKPRQKAPRQGTVYAVVGNSSKHDTGPLNHPVMAYSASLLGSMLIDIDADKLTARMLDDQGNSVDEFEIVKTDTPVVPRTCPGAE